MIDGKTTVGEIKDKVLDNGFDLIKDKGLRIKNSAGKKKKLKAERERGVQRDALHASRDAREEVDSQLKVFFGELKEIKAVIKLSAISLQHSAKKKKERKAESGKLKVVSRKGRKMKFRPEITRVKLDPEQAVLSCDCYNTCHKGSAEPSVHVDWDGPFHSVCDSSPLPKNVGNSRISYDESRTFYTAVFHWTDGLSSS